MLLPGEHQLKVELPESRDSSAVLARGYAARHPSPPLIGPLPRADIGRPPPHRQARPLVWQGRRVRPGERRIAPAIYFISISNSRVCHTYSPRPGPWPRSVPHEPTIFPPSSLPKHGEPVSPGALCNYLHGCIGNAGWPQNHRGIGRGLRDHQGRQPQATGEFVKGKLLCE